MKRTGFLNHGICGEHDPGAGHPERPGRLHSILERLRTSGITAELDRQEARLATREEIVRAHAPHHVERIEQAVAQAPCAIDGETCVSEASWEAALRASGGLLDACERVRTGTWDNAFCAVRPPGHHAEYDRAMGFCLFNNVAVAALDLIEKGLSRVAILDWDVHHGNGTQHLFEEDPRVFYASLHQWPLYPGTGARDERGRDDGLGTTLNCPQPAGSTEVEWLRALDQEILPALEEYRPEFVLLSAGFDAHKNDPLAQVKLETESYGHMTKRMLSLADEVCGGRLVSVLEGGYDLDALATSVETHLGALLEGA